MQANKVKGRPKRPKINNPVIEKICYAPNVTAIQSLFKIGFELEFHSFREGEEIDHDRARDHWRDNVTDRDLAYSSTDFNSLYNYARLMNRDVGELLDIAPNDSERERIETIIERAEETNYDNFIDNNASEFMDRVDADSLDIPSNCSLDDDGSVPNGGEIKPTDPIDVKEFMETIKDLPLNDINIDQGCSFHIHLSLPGVDHFYGKLMQAEMTAFVLHSDIASKGKLRKRFQSSKRSFFKPILSTEKFSFVHFHEEFCSWEFRCFGNLDNVFAMKKALFTAMRAFQHAYQVRYKLADSLCPQYVDSNAFHALCLSFIDNPLPAQEVFKQARTNHNRQAIGA